MNLSEVSKWRNWTGKAGAFLCLLLFLAALDGLVSQFREQPNVLRVLAGTSTKVNGTLRGDISDINQLLYESNSSLIRLHFDKVHSGFWLGGSMWRGVMEVDSRITPGEYQLSVVEKVAPGQKPFTTFLVKVYPDARSLQQSSKSFIQRTFGFSAWWIFAACLPLVIASFASTFYLSQKREALLSERGMAEIYKVVTRPEGYEITFDLGAKDGLQEGSRLMLLDENLQSVGMIEIQKVSENESSALVDSNLKVRPGYVVSK